MKMKKSTKVWLGIATIWPVVYIFVFIAAIVLFFALVASEGGSPGSDPGGPASMLLPFGFVGLMAVHMLTILDMLAMKVFYIVRVFKTEQLDQNMRIMWTLLLVFATIFAEPVFWYLYIWRDPPNTANTPSQLAGFGQRPAWGKQTTTREREAAYVPPREPPDWR